MNLDMAFSVSKTASAVSLLYVVAEKHAFGVVKAGQGWGIRGKWFGTGRG